MKISYLIILTIFSQLSHADEKLARDICRQIKRDIGQPDLCQNVSASYPHIRSIMHSNCLHVVAAFHYNSDEGQETCATTFGSFAPAHELQHSFYIPPVATAGPVTNAGLTEEAPPTISVGMNQCQEKSIEDYSCALGTPVFVPDLEVMLSTLSEDKNLAMSSKNAKYTEEACNCFKKSSRKSELKKGVVAFEADLQREKKKINDLIYKAAGVRILNSFAANLEDVNFYRTNNTSLLGGAEKARQLQCNDVSQYRQKTAAACSANKVDPKTMDERMSTLLSSLGDSKNEQTLEGKFAHLERKILDGDLESKVDGQEVLMTRVRYDQIRFGAAKGLPEVNFLNDITEALLDHPVLGKELDHAINVLEHSPGRAIFSMIKKENRPEVKELLMRMAEQKKNDGQLSKSLIAVLKSPNPDDLGILVEEKVNETLDLHPSIKAIYRDRQLFNKVRAASHKNNGHSFLGQMEVESSYLVDHYQARCDKIQKDFAEAVCVPGDNFIEHTNREDLNKLLTVFDNSINPNLKDLLICRIPRAQNEHSVFQKLAFRKWDRLQQSDYWAQRTKKPEELSNTFHARIAHIVRNGDKKGLAFLTGLTKMGDSYRAPDSEFVAQKTKNDLFSSISQAVVQTPEKDRDYTLAKGLANLSESLGGEIKQPGSENAAKNMMNYSAPLPMANNDNNSITKERKALSSRDALKEFLADKENATEVDKHLSQTKDEDHKELLRLQQELAKNKEMINSLAAQTEKTKLRQLQEKYQALEDSSVKRTPAAVPPQNDEEDRSSGPRTASFSGSSSVSQTSPGDFSRQNNVSPAQTSASESGGPATANNSPGLASARVNGAGIDGNFALSSVSKGEIIIEQSNSALINGQQMAPEDIGLVIKRYVEQTDLDVQTLKKLKDQEVVIKYKVMENGVEVVKTMKVMSSTLSPETKQFLETRIAMREQEVERQEARRAHSFATLKLLLGIKTQAMN